MFRGLYYLFFLIWGNLFGHIFGPDIEEPRDISDLPSASLTSFWDQTELEYDYIIVGGGIVGLSTAIEIKEQQPDALILVLEKGILPLGASSRNAGFACIGSLTEFLMDMELIGEEEAIEQVKERWEGLTTLRRKLGDSSIGFTMTGNYELISPYFARLIVEIDHVNQMLYPIFGDNVFERQDEKLEEFGFSKEHVNAIVLNKFEGSLDSGMLMCSLRKKAQELNILIRYGSKAERPVPVQNGLSIDVSSEQGKITFFAKAIGICINAFTSELIPEIKITPGRAQIILTEPLQEPIKFDAPIHMGEGFWFFRPMAGNRILLGGGRNLDFEGEKTTVFGTSANILGPLKNILNYIILPNQNPKIEKVWSGIMGFSDDHLPKIEEVSGLPNVVVGFGCNGMGVARGYRTGEKTARLLINCANRNL